MSVWKRIRSYVQSHWEIKRYFLIAGANLGGRSITAVYSNIGILKFPPEYKTYIDRFGIFASTNSLQVCSCSYEDQFVVDFTSKIPDDRIQKNFVRMLKEEGISCKEEKNEFPGCGEKQKKRGQKSDADFHIFVPGSCCDLRHVQLSDARNTELVLVRVSRLFLCMAGGSCGLSEAKKHPQE